MNLSGNIKYQDSLVIQQISEPVQISETMYETAQDTRILCSSGAFPQFTLP